MTEFGQYFEVISTLTTFDETDLASARDIFEHYKAFGVIKESEFDDDVWMTTDEYANIGFHFTFSKGTYDKYYRKLFGMELEQFVIYVKSFICVMMGKGALHTLVSFLYDIRRITSTPLDAINEEHDVLTINNGSMIIDFLTILPSENDVSDFVEGLEYYADASYDKSFNQRNLADFESYFLFGDILKDYWNSYLSERDRMFYYPLYLWWTFTGTIPQRPREFLLTPRNCLTQNSKGEYFLKIRRNRIKGNSDNKVVSYRINDDYSFDTIKIPDSLGIDIQIYITLTSDFEETELDTLFVTDPHYNFFGRSKFSKSRFLTYMNMNTILKSFFKDVVEGIYGYRVIFGKADGELLGDREICYIHLGDTRHISMINILAEGGSPLTAMALAGQASIYTAGHYFTNLRNLLDCKIYREFRRITGKTSVYSLKPIEPIHKTDGIILEDKAKCFSAHVASEDYTDCLSAIGPNGEIGYCPDCPFHRKKDSNFYTNDDIYLRNLESDCRELEKAVRQLNKYTGPEDIGRILLKVQADSISYANYMKEKINEQKKTC